MGVPFFYTWLINRYPLIHQLYNPDTFPTIDNLYLDLNGIIYKCAFESSLLNNMAVETSIDEIWFSIFNYVNYLINIVSPRKLVYIALDGVAPRAKMNNQRSRRFKSAKAYSDLDEALRKMKIIPEKGNFKNNNKISPGTTFMSELGKELEFFIKRKFVEDDNFKNVQVIFSGSDVPGEGEHKIMEFMRQLGRDPKFDQEETHCVYGADADLIMLSLITHLPHVVILREIVDFSRSKEIVAVPRRVKEFKFELLYIHILREYYSIEFDAYITKNKLEQPAEKEEGKGKGKGKKKQENSAPNPVGEVTLDRIIDDLNFLFLFIGNDFLPRIYGFEIKRGNFDSILDLYKEGIGKGIIKGPLNNNGNIVWPHVLQFLELMETKKLETKFIEQGLKEQDEAIAGMEIDQYDEEDEEDNERFLEEEKKREDRKITKALPHIIDTQEGTILDEIFSPGSPSPSPSPGMKSEESKDAPSGKEDEVMMKKETSTASNNNGQKPDEVEELKEQLPVLKPKLSTAAKAAELLNKDMAFTKQLLEYLKVNLPDCKYYYYINKMKLDLHQPGCEKTLQMLVLYYMQGLQFVMKYYYVGVPSWTWYYPYYYSPLLSDLRNLLRTFESQKVVLDPYLDFDKGEPFKPFHQLLMILPRRNAGLLPEPYAKFIEDQNSPLAPYFPDDFDVDPFGSTIESHFIALIPFIEDEKFFAAIQSIPEEMLSEDERQRNSHGFTKIYSYDQKGTFCLPIRNSHPKQFPQEVKVPLFVQQFTYETFISQHDELVRLQEKQDFKTSETFPTLFQDKRRIQFCIREIRKRFKVKIQLCLEMFPEKPQEKLLQEFSVCYQRYNMNTLPLVYIDYPHQTQAQLIGFMTRTDLFAREQIGILEDLKYNVKNHEEVFFNLLNDRLEKTRNQGILHNDRDLCVCFVRIRFNYRRKQNGSIWYGSWAEDVCLSDELSIQQKIRYKSQPQGEKNLTIQEEFPINCKVALLETYPGQLGRVVNYDNKGQLVVTPYHYYGKSLKKIDKGRVSKGDFEEPYYSLESVSVELKLSRKTLELLLGRFQIMTDNRLRSSEKIGERVNVGLQIVDFKYRKVVPELARIITFYDQKRREQVMSVQLSKKAIDLLKEYMAFDRAIFEAIEKNISSLNKVYNLTVNDIYGQLAPGTSNASDDNNAKILRTYFWLLGHPLSQQLLYSENSLMTNNEHIRKVLAQLDVHKQVKHEEERKSITIDPNFVHRYDRDKYVMPYFVEHPPSHQLYDRVVCLNAIAPPYFVHHGMLGTIIGILKDRYEILLDEPFMGGTSLHGRTPWFHGVLLHFNDFFNISQWMKYRNTNSCYIAGRFERIPNHLHFGWDGNVFWEKIIFPQPLKYREEAKAEGGEERKENGGAKDEESKRSDKDQGFTQEDDDEPRFVKKRTQGREGIYIIKKKE